MGGEPGTHRESGPVHVSGPTGHGRAGDQAQGGGVQRRSHQPSDGKNTQGSRGVSHSAPSC